MNMRHTLRRYHIWLGWIVGLPILFWVVSGLIMIVKPLDEVRGRHIIDTHMHFALKTQPVVPEIAGLEIEHMMLEHRAAGPRWVVKLEKGPTRMADPATGQWLPPISAVEAVAEVMHAWKGSGRILSVVRTDRKNPPLDLREPVETWQVTLDDGTHVYIDRATGGIMATRTRFWRFYDWMWGLHIMDMTTRENPHNAWVATLGIASLVMALLAMVMLPLTIKRRRKSQPK
ncbi:MAG: PepSY domain-containing protein [Sphingomicrobium sp.]